MDTDGDRFVARRGTQGDSWSWQGTPPPGPESDSSVPKVRKSSLWARVLATLATAFAGLGAAARPVFSGLGAAIDWFAAKPSPPSKKPRSSTLPAAPTRVLQPEAPTVGDVAAAAGATDEPLPRSIRERPRLAIPWSRFAPRVSVPRLTRPRFHRPHLRSRLGSRGIPEDVRAPLALFAALALAAILSATIALAVSVLDHDGDGAAGVIDLTQKPSLGPTTPAETDRPTTAPSSAPTSTDSPTPAPTPTVAVTEPAPPHSGPALAFWSPAFGEWWFSDLSGTAGQYEEGQTIPLLLRWPSTPGQAYNVDLVYDCATPDARGAIDYLSGIQDWPPDVLLGRGGPDRLRPDAAVPVPDIANFPQDDPDSGVLFLFGGQFTLLPSPVSPGGDCEFQRLIELSVQATASEVWLIGSIHLAAEADYGANEGASSHDEEFGVQATIGGLGTVRANVQPGAITDVSR